MCHDITEILLKVALSTIKNTDIENDPSVWHQTHYNASDKNNNIIFEDFDKHYHQYHSSS